MLLASRVVDKYLAHYAEPEAALASAVAGSFSHAVVVPLCAEQAGFIESFAPALESSGRALLCLVVNGRLDADPSVHDANARSLDALTARVAARELVPGVLQGEWSGGGVLLIDRASAGRRFPPRQGVGLARKIGADLALALLARGCVASPFIRFSDADVELPAEYLSVAEPRAAALLYPFSHVPGDEPRVSELTALYEVWLRYYVLGLAHAGSPYAYHSIGSTIAVHAEGYAMVRGVPRRLAGEDFHLLAKLAKLGPIKRASSSPIRIRARRSARVPFGTGRGVGRLAELGSGETLRLMHPGVFDGLRVWLSALDHYAREPIERHLQPGFEALGDAAALAAEVWLAADMPRRLQVAGRQYAAGASLRRRLHANFDALATLKLLHTLRDRHFGEQVWRDVLASAAFVDRVLLEPFSAAAALAALEPLDSVGLSS